MSGDGVIVSGRKSRPASCNAISSAGMARLRSPHRISRFPGVDFRFGSERNTILDCFVVAFGSRFQRRFDFFFHRFVELGRNCVLLFNFTFFAFSEIAIAQGDTALAASRITSASSKLRSRNSTRSSTVVCARASMSLMSCSASASAC